MANPIDPNEEPVRLQTTVTAVVAVVTAVVTGYGIDLPPEFATTITAGVAAAANGIMGKRTRKKVTPEAHLPAPVPTDPLGVPTTAAVSPVRTTGGGPL